MYNFLKNYVFGRRAKPIDRQPIPMPETMALLRSLGLADVW